MALLATSAFATTTPKPLNVVVYYKLPNGG